MAKTAITLSLIIDKEKKPQFCVNIVAFWVVVLCSFIGHHQYFRATY
jgi:hypothetical protein